MSEEQKPSVVMRVFKGYIWEAEASMGHTVRLPSRLEHRPSMPFNGDSTLAASCVTLGSSHALSEYLYFPTAALLCDQKRVGPSRADT